MIVKNSGNCGPTAIVTVLDIVLRSRHASVYIKAREIAIELMRQQISVGLEGAELEQLVCNDYEFSCWIDTLTLKSLQGFKALLLQVAKNKLDHTIVSSQSLKHFSLQGMGLFHTPLLSHTLNTSSGLQHLATKVAVRSILFHKNPLSLAALVCHGVETGRCQKSPLSNFCDMLLHFSASRPHEKREQLSTLISSTLSSNSLAYKFLMKPGAFDVPDHYIEAGIRQCLNLALLEDDQTRSREHILLLRRLLSRGLYLSSKSILACLENHPFLKDSSFDRILIRILEKSSDQSSALRMTQETCTTLPSLLREVLLAYILDDKPPQDVADQIMKRLLHKDFNSIDSNVLGSILVRCKILSSNAPCHLTFQVWLQTPHTELPVREALETTMLSYNSGSDAKFLSMAYDVPTIELARTCFDGFKASHKSNMLAKLVQIGHVQLGELVLDCISPNNDTPSNLGESWYHPSLWNKGCLDSTVSMILMQYQNFTRSKIIVLIDAIGVREHVFRFGPLKGGSEHWIGDGFMTNSLLRLLLNPYNVKYLPMIIRLVESLLDSDSSDYQQILRDTFELLISILPQYLKGFFKSSSSSNPHTGSLMKLLKRLLEFESLELQHMELDLDAVVKSCLKYGLNTGEKEKVYVASRCIGLVRLLLERFVGNRTTLKSKSLIQEKYFLMTPSRIFAMIVSHSKFTSLLELSGSSSTVLEVIKLLVCCTCLDRPTQVLETEILDQILSSYRYGTREQDQHLRKFLSIYFDECESPGFTDNIYRKIMLVKSQEIPGLGESGWEFLPDTLNYGRVRATLNQFPLDCSMKTPFPQVGAPEESMVHAQTEDMDRTSSDSINEPNIAILDHSWTGTGNDNRYDPGFLMPAIFAALESYARGVMSLEIKQHVSDNWNNENSSPEIGRLCGYVQRLIEKGALSLTIATLCSTCEDLRKVAISSLGIFQLALNSDEAREVKGWRDRPQLGLLVNSIHRGLVMRRQMLLSLENEAKIPKMTPLATIFLARSALILSKPGDPLFVATNRYFLKVGAAHGAFPDFNRLPAFIPLFCSTSDESDQSQKDRTWALSVLKDSFVDPSCYRLVSACHAPELMLTALEHSSESEQGLILDVLHQLFLFGGQAASVHLVDRLGLLSLLRILVSKSKFYGAPTSLKQSLCAVADIAIERATQFVSADSKKQLANEIRLLLQPLVQVFLSTERVSTANDKFADRFCKTLSKIVQLLSSLSPLQVHFSPNGLSISVTLDFLTTCPAHHKSAMVEATLDVSLVRENNASIVDLVSMYLSNINGSNAAKTLLRFHAIAQNYHWDFGGKLLELLLQCSSIGLRFSREQWLDCLEVLMKKRDEANPSSLSTIANTILEQARK